MRLHRTACICASNLGYTIRPTTTTHGVGLGGTHEASFALAICCCFIFRLHLLHFLPCSVLDRWLSSSQIGWGACIGGNGAGKSPGFLRLTGLGLDVGAGTCFLFAYVIWRKASCCRAVGFCRDGRGVRSRALTAWAVARLCLGPQGATSRRRCCRVHRGQFWEAMEISKRERDTSFWNYRHDLQTLSPSVKCAIDRSEICPNLHLSLAVRCFRRKTPFRHPISLGAQHEALSPSWSRMARRVTPLRLLLYILRASPAWAPTGSHRSHTFSRNTLEFAWAPWAPW